MRVQPGVVWGELDAGDPGHGLATTGGRMTTTGVAGFVLGSGSGWLERLFGLACRQPGRRRSRVRGRRVVRADDSGNAELLWGLRGGGGNFGVVTEFTLRLHPVAPEMYGGMLLYPRAQAPEVLRGLRDFLRDAPSEVVRGRDLHARARRPRSCRRTCRALPAVAVVAGYFGNLADGAEALAPLKQAVEPAVDLMGPTTYLDFQAITDAGNPPGRRNYWRSELLRDAPDEALDATDRVRRPSGIADQRRRARDVPVGRSGTSPTTRPRSPAAAPSGVFHCYASWTDTDDAANIAWARASQEAVRPWTMAGIALNFLSDIDETPRSGRRSEPRSTSGWSQLKQRWDPENVFSMNQNIPPGG